ncbi:Alpha/Beta hydrolase protein [Talaromyces proteolyticus]|uniref:Alpha/Beta hydrolase protein n=1 Tax=Talaromyces proteolyticus TaxID=1131652 RepID=A0AAD4KXT9_9EURO|nr:Alpha/Beta hydrolase protein [Talaromyces proteolyticus]KAH8703541.1 Alpha/Beta hydrolase protein [Talaromyces proteolyticus]
MSNLQPLKDHALIGEAEKIPVNKPVSFISISPIVVPAPGRVVDLQVKISAPRTGNDLPIILLSHGQGQSNHLSSLNGYGPLANFWASHGFAVIQPTHLSSKSLSLGTPPSEGPLYWRSRVEDMKHILDHLDDIESAVPEVKGRLDRTRIAVVGHSMGGHTASLLLGARTTDSTDGTVTDWTDRRIKAGILLGAPGSPGEDGAYLSTWVLENFPWFKEISFADMATPALVVAGDNDSSPHLNNRGPDWHFDPYNHSTGPKSLLTLYGAGHIFGGISGFDAAETDDESPERVAVVQRLTWAYLRSTLYPEDTTFSVVSKALADLPSLGKVDSK